MILIIDAANRMIAAEPGRLLREAAGLGTLCAVILSLLSVPTFS